MSNNTKDFKKYAYFRSRARNYAVCIKPERRRIVDGEVVIKSHGLRVEFRNHLFRVEKDELGEKIIKHLRDKMLAVKDLDPKRKMLFEEKKQDILIPEHDVEKIVKEKDTEIAELKAKLLKKEKK
jgi:hypothetical protein